MKITQYDKNFEYAPIGDPNDDSLRIELTDGSRWLLIEREPGVLDLSLSEGGATLSSGIIINPRAANSVNVRVDSSRDDRREIMRLRGRIRKLAEQVAAGDTTKVNDAPAREGGTGLAQVVPPETAPAPEGAAKAPRKPRGKGTVTVPARKPGASTGTMEKRPGEEYHAGSMTGAPARS